MLIKSDYSPHPCLTTLLVLIGSEFCPSLYLMCVFEFSYGLSILLLKVAFVCLPALKSAITFLSLNFHMHRCFKSEMNPVYVFFFRI
jgi:hypothetical protein